MSINGDEPCGEFDWFAVDSKGEFALFSRFETGFIPEIVMRSFREHEALSESIDLPNWGSEDVWKNFSAKGLHVYDWKPNNGPYILKCTAPSFRDSAFIERIKVLNGLPIYSGVFRETESMASLENWCRV